MTYHPPPVPLLSIDNLEASCSDALIWHHAWQEVVHVREERGNIKKEAVVAEDESSSNFLKSAKQKAVMNKETQVLLLGLLTRRPLRRTESGPLPILDI